MFWLIVVAIVVATGVALFLATRVQQKGRQRRLRLEITNQGNVRSRYYLRAESSGDLLQFHFALDGDPLPAGGSFEEVEEVEEVEEPTEVAESQDQSLKSQVGAAGRQADQKVNRAMGTGSAVANVLATIGSMLPYSIGGPLLRKAAQIHSGQMKVRQVQRVPDQARQVRALVPSRKSSSPASRSSPGGRSAPAGGASLAGGRRQAAQVTRASTAVQGWVETPSVRPKEALALDLVVQTSLYGPGRNYSFCVLSRSADEQDAALIVEQGSVQIGGGFWSHRVLPYTVILAAAAGLLLLAGWLASSGVLAW